MVLCKRWTQVLQKHHLHGVLKFWEKGILYFVHVLLQHPWTGEDKCPVVAVNKFPGVFECLWSVFPAISMETFNKDRVCLGDCCHVSYAFFQVYRFTEKNWVTPCSLQSMYPQILPIPSWKWASGMRCQLQIHVASLPQFRHPILVYLSLIPSSITFSSHLSKPLAVFPLLRLQPNVCEGGHLCLSGSAWRDVMA